MNTLSKYIDHTTLKPTVIKEDIEKLCQEAIEFGFATVCIPPIYTDLARRLTSDSEVKVGTVVGFPFGYDHIASKVETIKRAIDMGADECDVVVNIAMVKNNNWDYIRNEIEGASTAVHRKNNKIIKLILETAYLNDEELEQLCNLCIENDVDFAKTSTGYAPQGANLEVVRKMKGFLGEKVMIKASGGIKTTEFAQSLIEAGAQRLGTSSGLKIIGK